MRVGANRQPRVGRGEARRPPARAHWQKAVHQVAASRVHIQGSGLIKIRQFSERFGLMGITIELFRVSLQFEKGIAECILRARPSNQHQYM